MLTFGDLCCGGGGASLGAIAAGLTPLWAIEHSPEIAACYRRNVGDHVIVGDVATADIAGLQRVDVLWGSFPCQEHSVARSKSLAPRGDGDLALCVLNYARVLRPKVIVMENVPPWRRSAVYRTVVSGLSALGYFVDGQLVDASLHGVPQTRRRCIVRAVWQGLVPALPAPTMRIGWYAALEDLLPGLPESKFAKWQLARLGDLGATRLVQVKNTGQEWGDSTRAAGQPAFAVMTDEKPSHAPRAFLVEGGNPTGHFLGTEAGDAAPTVTAGAGKQRPLRAFLAHPTADNDRFPAPGGDDPAFAITGTHGTPRAWLDRGRVVALDARCLARLQTFPDSYELPANRALAGRIVGNAAPPELARRILEGLLPVVEQGGLDVAS